MEQLHTPQVQTAGDLALCLHPPLCLDCRVSLCVRVAFVSAGLFCSARVDVVSEED